MMPQVVGEIWQYERHKQMMIVIVTSFRPNIYSRQYAFCECYIISSQAIAEFPAGQIKKIYINDQDGWKRVA